MSSYLKMAVCGVVLGLSGCATMAGWTPDQTAAFVGAMQTTANAVDPYEYAGPRQPVEPPVEGAPVAQVYNGRPNTAGSTDPYGLNAASQQQQASIQQQIQSEENQAPIGANIPTPVHCWVSAFNTIECN